MGQYTLWFWIQAWLSTFEVNVWMYFHSYIMCHMTLWQRSQNSLQQAPDVMPHIQAALPMIVSMHFKTGGWCSGLPHKWREGTFWYPKESLLYLCHCETPWLRWCFPEYVVFNLCAVIKVYSTIMHVYFEATLMSVRLKREASRESVLKCAFSLLTSRGRLLWLYRSLYFMCGGCILSPDHQGATPLVV